MRPRPTKARRSRDEGLLGGAGRQAVEGALDDQDVRPRARGSGRDRWRRSRSGRGRRRARRPACRARCAHDLRRRGRGRSGRAAIDACTSASAPAWSAATRPKSRLSCRLAAAQSALGVVELDRRLQADRQQAGEDRPARRRAAPRSRVVDEAEAVPALAVAQREADQALPVPRRLGAAAALAAGARRDPRNRGGRRRRRRRSARRAGGRPGCRRRSRSCCVAIDRPIAASGFVSSSASRIARTKGCDGEVRPPGRCRRSACRRGGSRRPSRGGCSARIEGIDEAVEPLRRERGAHRPAGLDDRRGELRLPFRIERAGQAAGMDQAVEPGRRRGVGEPVLDLGGVAVGQP